MRGKCSLKNQKFNNEVEIFVLDDYFKEDIKTKELCSNYNINYLHTGRTKNNKDFLNTKKLKSFSNTFLHAYSTKGALTRGYYTRKSVTFQSKF